MKFLLYVVTGFHIFMLCANIICFFALFTLPIYAPWWVLILAFPVGTFLFNQMTVFRCGITSVENSIRRKLGYKTYKSFIDFLLWGKYDNEPKNKVSKIS